MIEFLAHMPTDTMIFITMAWFGGNTDSAESLGRAALI
jgi:hypothetical protein